MTISKNKSFVSTKSTIEPPEPPKFPPKESLDLKTTGADKAQRRERIATAILAGIHANAAFADIDCRMAAKCAIDGAEALIAELD